MFKDTGHLEVEYVDGRLWILKDPVVYVDDRFVWPAPSAKLGLTIAVPVGFCTDFASIPKVFWNILPPTGSYSKAAIVHDYLYVAGKAEGLPVTRAYADGIFKQAMAELGTNVFVRNIMWAAVRMGAGKAWDKRRAADGKA